MTIHLQTRAERWGSFSDIDLAAQGIGDFKLIGAYSHAASLSWSAVAAQHTTPIPRLAFVKFWDDAINDPDGIPYSSSNPWFVGYVEDVQPGDDANLVEYTAYDPTFRAAKEVTIFDAPYVAGGVPDVQPVRAIGSIPRLVYNVKIDADDDFAYQVGQDGTWSQIVAGLLEYCYQPLYWLDAAPGDGGDFGNDVPYLFADLFGDLCSGTSTTAADYFTSTTTTESTSSTEETSSTETSSSEE